MNSEIIFYKDLFNPNYGGKYNSILLLFLQINKFNDLINL